MYDAATPRSSCTPCRDRCAHSHYRCAYSHHTCTHSRNKCTHARPWCTHARPWCTHSCRLCAHSHHECTHSRGPCTHAHHRCAHSRDSCTHSRCLCTRSRDDFIRGCHHFFHQNHDQQAPEHPLERRLKSGKPGEQPALFYARALPRPTCRWSTAEQHQKQTTSNSAHIPRPVITSQSISHV